MKYGITQAPPLLPPYGDGAAPPATVVMLDPKGNEGKGMNVTLRAVTVAELERVVERQMGKGWQIAGVVEVSGGDAPVIKVPRPGKYTVPSQVQAQRKTLKSEKPE